MTTGDRVAALLAEIEAERDALTRLRRVMAALRDPEVGCPWDKEQTFETIAPYTIEEAYEVSDAIARKDLGDLRQELGDLLLQVVYHARIAEEAGEFDFDDVAVAVVDKMIGRHPHVFGDAATADWDAIKEAERARAGKARESVLDDVPLPLPALTRAEKLQKRAARVGFDWPDVDGALEKLVEETAELKEAAAAHDIEAMMDEFGDVIFALVNVGRKMRLDPEEALRRTNAKFSRRFRKIEAALAQEGRRVDEADLSELDHLWDAAKAAERAAS